MTTFTITNHISEREYVTLFLKNFFIRPKMLLVGVVSAIIIFCYLGTTRGWLPDVGFSDPVYLLLPAGYFILLPALMFWNASRLYKSSAKVRQLVEYTFDEKGVSYKGDSYEGKYDWNTLLRVKEKEGFLLLFHNRTAADFIRKDRLSEAEIQFIKEHVNSGQ